MAQMVKNFPAMQDTWVWSLGQEDPLEKEMVTQSSINGLRSLAGYSSWECKESDTTEWLMHMRMRAHTHTLPKNFYMLGKV